MTDHMKLVLFLVAETGLFAAASLIHAGVLVSGFEHARAMIAEGVIGVVLALGLLALWLWLTHAATVALAVQAFALLGTLVGVFTIAIGVGPQTACEAAFHVVLLAVLLVGILVAWRSWRI